jgi:hypothetical protein
VPLYIKLYNARSKLVRSEVPYPRGASSGDDVQTRSPDLCMRTFSSMERRSRIRAAFPLTWILSHFCSA